MLTLKGEVEGQEFKVILYVVVWMKMTPIGPYRVALLAGVALLD